MEKYFQVAARRLQIDEILKLISEIWHKNPDMRLLQLLLNVCLSDVDFYYTEDSLLEQWLHDHYDNIQIERNSI